MSTSESGRDRGFQADEHALRDPLDVVGLWDTAPGDIGDRLRHRESGDFWGTLFGSGIELLITREYEHLLIALTASEAGPSVSYLRLPHPNGIAVSADGHTVMVASTRSPNTIYRFQAVQTEEGPVLLPRSAQYLPGRTYLHDLAFIGGRLHANAVGCNTVAMVETGGLRHVWWPRSVERAGTADTSVNHLQLNSIAAGASLEESFFAASVAAPGGRYRPGHPRFRADRAGVVFSGRTREPIVHGLTRPHSVRFRDRELWLANSGYGELARVDGGRHEAICTLPGWTRGLAIAGGLAFVGTSRILPRFRAYAPGVTSEVCGVHIVDLRTGVVRGSLTWPEGNQIFAIDWLPRAAHATLPYNRGSVRRQNARAKELFFSAAADLEVP